ncbi:hypothetical protein ElyMa_004005400 [Elysia marginata]|uniref:60S ribosomal protein L28 n=1 Tax=Elysia marginata TaxID=1093978 RepID=A0AAV4FZV4_9GAST|nr:hypothetical protein ElyMa_004005400 [Elysia marginata]
MLRWIRRWKREAGGETRILSQSLKRALHQGLNFGSAKDMVDYLSPKLGTEDRKYLLVEPIKRTTLTLGDDVLAIPGTRKYYQFQAKKDYVVQAQQLACFCTACLEGLPERCINRDVVGTYTVHKCKVSSKTEKSWSDVGDFVKLTCKVNKVKKTLYATIRQTLRKRTKNNPQFCAKMVRNLATPRTPEKRRAIRDLFQATPVVADRRKSTSAPAPENGSKKMKKKKNPKKMTNAARLRAMRNLKMAIFYTSSEIVRPLPHKRYTTKRGAAYVRLVTMRGAYKLFRAKNPDVKIGATKFNQLKPRTVRKLGSVNVETCLCLCCQNLR